MATFYGQVFGNGKTSASKTGSRNSGLRTSCQSYGGSVIVEVHETEDGKTWFEINVSDTSSAHGRNVFIGDLDELCQRLCGKSLQEVCH